MTSEYGRLRMEFTSNNFRRNMVKKLGATCCNCSSKHNIEYHHVVPLTNGGTKI